MRRGSGGAITVNDNPCRTEARPRCPTCMRRAIAICVALVGCASAGSVPARTPGMVGRRPAGDRSTEVLAPPIGDDTLCDRGLAWACARAGRPARPRPASPGSCRSPLLEPRIAATGNDPREHRVLEAALDGACDAGDGFACERRAFDALVGTDAAAPDRARAAELHERACGLGCPDACVRLAWQLGRGEGVPQAPALAVALVRRGCDGGQLVACNALGWFYREGIGVRTDRGIAFLLHTEACEQGLADGCHALGSMVLNGDGVSPDRERARALWRKACQLGSRAACDAGVLEGLWSRPG